MKSIKLTREFQEIDSLKSLSKIGTKTSIKNGERVIVKLSTSSGKFIEAVLELMALASPTFYDRSIVPVDTYPENILAEKVEVKFESEDPDQEVWLYFSGWFN